MCSLCRKETLLPPLCYPCLLAKGLELKPTLIVQSKGSTERCQFLGLFVTRDFRKGDAVVPYVGERLDRSQCQQRYGIPLQKDEFHCSYVMKSGSKDVWIDSSLVRGIGSYVNSHTTGNVAVSLCFSRFPKLVALKHIYEGEELYLNYDLSAQVSHTTTSQSDPSLGGLLAHLTGISTSKGRSLKDERTAHRSSSSSKSEDNSIVSPKEIIDPNPKNQTDSVTVPTILIDLTKNSQLVPSSKSKHDATRQVLIELASSDDDI